MSSLTLPAPIAAYYAADTQGPDHGAGNFRGSPIDLKFFFRLERGLISNLEISV